MQNEVYDVRETVVGGIRLQLEFQPRVNFSLVTAGIPFVRAVVVHNETGAQLDGLELAAGLTLPGNDTLPWRRSVPGPILANSVTRIDKVHDFDVFTPLLAGATESTPGSLVVTATAATTATVATDAAPGAPRTTAASAPTTTAASAPTARDSAQLSTAVEVSAYNEWLNFPGLHAALAAFVQPNTHTVTAILRAASQLLLDQTGSGSLQGYQAGPDRAHVIAGAVYEALRARQISYVNPPASFELTGQKVRTTEQVLRDRFGTCIDLSVLYAACLEAAGLFPVIVITRNHAFAGFYTDEHYGETAAVANPNVIATMIESGLVRAVELTGIGPGRESLSFSAATTLGRDAVRQSFDLLQTLVDVTRARLEGIRPMPQFGGREDLVDGGAGTDAGTATGATAEQQLEAERPFVARSTLKNLELVVEDEIVRGVLERNDPSPTRFKTWKRDLLDLTLRNPLLNMPHTQKVLDLLVPGGMLPLLDDVVHSGKSVRLTGGVDSSELQKLAGIRATSEVAPDALISTFKASRTVYSTLSDERHRTQLRAMKREAETLEQETGSNYLYLTIGTLVHTKADGKEARAPLFLLPVRLTGGLAFTPYALKAAEDEVAQPNLCLLQWLTTTKGLDLTELRNPTLDDSGLAINTALAGMRRQLLTAELPYRIDESASLAILRFSTFQIWKDLDENWGALLQSPVVRHLVERPGETFADPAGNEPPVIDEASLRLPIAADGSQMAAVVRATSGQSFVLEGPPGTGKSQTITNLIAHALTAGKKVLFVAEKQAALEVVKRRLDAIGLGPFGLELHGAKQSMNTIRDQLRAALDVRVATDENAWAAADARLRSAVVELERYPQLVHEKNPRGYSLWSAYDATVTLGDGQEATIPPAWLSASDAEDDATQTTRAFADAAARFGLRPRHPWIVSGAVDPAALDLPAIRAAQGELASARPRVAALGPESRAALDELYPGGALTAAVSLLGARDAALLASPDSIAAVDSTTWRDGVAALRLRLAGYRTTHARILADATPAAFELEGLDAAIARSEKLDAAWFFPELRRRSLRERVQPVLKPGVVVDAERFTATLRDLALALADVAPVRAAAGQLPGLVLPSSWQPYSETAAEQLDAAVWVAQTASWLAKAAPRAWAALPAASPGDSAILRDLDAAWTKWLAAIGGSALTVRQWTGPHDWVEAWADDEATWARDLDSTGVLQPQRFVETRRLLQRLRETGLGLFSDQLATGEIAPADAQESLLRGLARGSLEERSATFDLGSFDGDAHDRTTAAYLEQGGVVRDQLRRAVAARLIEERPFDPGNLRGEVAELKRQIDRKRGGLSFREVSKRYPRALTSVVPCFLMSPGSVAHFLDAGSIEFDLVIFDEASQIRVPQAIGAMGRGKAVIVVGDSKQMPPTRIMQVDAGVQDAASPGSTGPRDSAGNAVDAPANPDGAPADPVADELVVEDLESILSEAVESGLPQLWLNWHYRSEDESLIAFSNATYYDNKLVSLPSPHPPGETGVTWRRVDGSFDRGRSRTNEVEARAIVDEITARRSDPSTADESIGVVSFNIQQRDLILNLLEDSGDPLVQRALTAEPGAELFVKNLENVQGDERDVILFSLAFSPDPRTGVMPLNFGPLNLGGGERRLNVAVTRARKRIVLFSSFDPGDIDLSRSNAQGIADLKSYLEFASTGALKAGRVQDAAASNKGRFVDELAGALREAGFEVQTDLGLSSFKVDLAVRRPGSDEWRVAVMVDGPGWASRPTVSDRDGSPQLLVDLMGWPEVTRVWLPAWLRDRAGVLASIRAAFDRPATPRSRFAVLPSAAPASAPALALAPTAQAASAPDAPSLAARESPAARELPGHELPSFVAAVDSVIASQSVLDNPRLARPAVLRIAAEVLATEGPIPVPRLIATVARRFGYSRIGETKRAQLGESIRQRFRIVGDFTWPDALDPATWREARRSPSTAVRALSEVSPHEIANAMELLVRESLSMSHDELIKDAGEVLGYGRLTAQARAWLEAGLDLARRESRILQEGARFVTP